AGAVSHERSGSAFGGGVSCCKQGPGSEASAVASSFVRVDTTGPLSTARSGRFRFANRVHQYRESDAVESGYPTQRSRHSERTWRQPPPLDQASANRKCVARWAWRIVGIGTLNRGD